MKRKIFLFFAIVSVVGMLAISGCGKEKETYTVAFNPNGGIGTMAAQTFTEGEAQALMRNAFTYDGYTFTGWNTVQGGSGASYIDGQSITVTIDMTLYAQWASNGTNPTHGPTPSNTVTVTFDANGGTGEMAPQTFPIGTAQALVANSFSFDPLHFLNWNTVADGTGTSYSDLQEITIAESMKLYAQWDGGMLNEHMYIDLGLPNGTKWALTNVGSTTPEGYGSYCGSIHVDTIGSWGAGWRMPTKEEMDELYSNCTHEWTTQNGVNGEKFIGTNGNSIFLPAAGQYSSVDPQYAGSSGYYWSSSSKYGSPYEAWILYFNSDNCRVCVYDSYQHYGISVRPICAQ